MSKFIPVITYRAWKKINCILQRSLQDSMLYSVESGGCNGFNFKLEILDDSIKNKLYSNKRPATLIQSPINNNQHIYIDPESELYLLNTEIDFITEDYNKQIFDSKFVFNIDPTIMRRCGCGTSFNIK